MKVKYLHTMVRVNDIEKSKAFYCDLLGLEEIRRSHYEEGKFSLVFLAAPNQSECTLELTHNWDGKEKYSEGRNFGHLAYEVENIYDICSKIRASGVEINRPPRDGRMAFVKSPDNISIELLQAGSPLPVKEPWLSMPNSGSW